MFLNLTFNDYIFSMFKLSITYMTSYRYSFYDPIPKYESKVQYK